MDVGVGRADAGKTRWLILVYHLPREPSRHGSPCGANSRPWVLCICKMGSRRCLRTPLRASSLNGSSSGSRRLGGEATLWEALPNTISEGKNLVAASRDAREEGYRTLIEGAERIRRKAEFGGDGASLLEELAKNEREFRAERRRDYFRSPLRAEAAEALRAARRILKEGIGPADHTGAEEGG
jgi:hypothetical protein